MDSGGALMQRYERITAIPMIVVSLAFVALLIYPIAFTTSSAVEADLRAANGLAWSFLAVDYLVRFALAPQKLAFVKGNVLDSAVVMLPLLAPLRVFSGLRALRVLRTLTIVSAIAKTQRRSKNIVSPQSVGTILLVRSP